MAANFIFLQQFCYSFKHVVNIVFSIFFYLLIAIYPPVKFEIALIFSKLLQDSDFTVFVSIATIFWFIKIKSDVHYLLVGIYPTVKFQICSFITFRFIAGSRFPDGQTDRRTGDKLKVPSETCRGLINHVGHYTI